MSEANAIGAWGQDLPKTPGMVANLGQGDAVLRIDGKDGFHQG